MNEATLAVVVDGVLALAIIAGATVLLALGRVDGTTALALYGVAVTLTGGSAKALLALRVPAADVAGAGSRTPVPPAPAPIPPV